MEAVQGLLERQVTEIEAIQATFSEPGEFVLEPCERSGLAQAQHALSVPQVRDRLSPPQQQLSGRITLLDAVLNHAPVSLKFSLPAAYPTVSPLLQV